MIISAFHVICGIPDNWEDLVGKGPRSALRPWIEVEPRRLPGPYHTFVLTEDGTAVIGAGGTVVGSVSERRWADPYLVLSQGIPGEPLGELPWAGLAPEEIFPCLLLMYPEYETRLAGPGADDPGTIRRFILQLCGWAEANGIRSVVALYLPPEAEVFIRELGAYGFSRSEVARQNSLTVTWDGLDGYLAALPGRRRRAVRRELSVLAGHDIRLEQRSMESCRPDIVRLMIAHAAKYGRDTSAAAVEPLLDRIQGLFPAESIAVFAAIRDGRVLGFTLFVRQDHEWVGIVTGTDTTCPDARFIHFATAYYEPAALAGSQGISELSYGLGASQAKRLRGCRQTVMSATALRLGRTTR